MAYAKNTSTPIDRSQSEVRKTLTRYGATGFAFAEQMGKHTVMFELGGRRVKIDVPMPIRGQTKTGQGYLMGQLDCEREARRRWRCVVLVIKAKLESVESKITTFEQEFMAFVVLPNGHTVGSLMLPQIAKAYQGHTMLPLLGSTP